jgi:AcrR family transcriptional regulator
MRAIAVQENIRDIILDAADRLLARYGYRKMTMEDLAQEVGIGKGTIYLHFRSKEEIVLSHVDRIVERVLEPLHAIAESDAAPATKIREMLVTRVMFRFDSVQHYTESISEVLRDLRSALLERRERYFALEAEAIAGVLKEGQRARVFRRRDPEETARALVTATNALLPFSLSTRELGKRKDVEQAVQRIADLLLNGL